MLTGYDVGFLPTRKLTFERHPVPARPPVAGPLTEKEVRDALNLTLAGTLPSEDWEQPVAEVFGSLAAGIAARASDLLWDDPYADDAGPQTDPALDRWWGAARQTLADELTPAFLAFAVAHPERGPAMRARRRFLVLPGGAG